MICSHVTVVVTHHTIPTVTFYTVATATDYRFPHITTPTVADVLR